MTDLQKRILDIFREVRDILDRNGITYFAIGGTCIGAVRHGGFIPWDDDLDIAVPIEQFGRMLDLLKAELPPHLELYTGAERKHYRYIFVKVTDNRTTFIEKTEIGYPDAYKGVFIDIMPISGVLPDKRFYSRIKRYFSMNVRRRFEKGEGGSSFVRRAARWAAAHLPVRYSFFSDRYMAFLAEHPFEGAEYTGYVWWSEPEKLTFPKRFFAETVELPFEDTVMKCPAGYDGYLTAQFGNYMEYPPEKDREAHHHALVRTDVPYGYYKDNPGRVREDYRDE